MAKEMKSRTSRPSSSLLLLFYKFCGLLVCFAMFAAVTNWENLSDEDFASSSSFSSSSLRRRLFHLFDDIAGVDPKYKAPIPYGAPKKDFFVSISITCIGLIQFPNRFLFLFLFLFRFLFLFLFLCIYLYNDSVYVLHIRITHVSIYCNLFVVLL